jgi:hypothetical protein
VTLRRTVVGFAPLVVVSLEVAAGTAANVTRTLTR